MQRRTLAKLAFLLLLLSFAGLLAFFPKAAYASVQATFYASPNGNGSACSQSSPCSLAGVQSKVQTVDSNMSGDIVVNLLDGTYTQASTLTFSNSDSGTNGYNVIYQAYNYGNSQAAHPVISGGQQITGWTLHDSSKNIWQANVGTSLQTRELYVNGTRATRATGQAPATLTKTSSGYTMSNTTMDSWGNPADIEFVYTGSNSGVFAWAEDRCQVDSISGTTITMTQPCFADAAAWNNLNLPTSIENAYELLDQPGEWYLNHSSGILYYIPRSGETMSSATVIAPTLQTLVSGAGTLDSPVHNMQFKGLQFSYATWLGANSSAGFAEQQANGTISSLTQGQCNTISPAGSCPYGAWTKTPANVKFHAAQNIRFERDTFTHLGGAGLDLEFGSQNNTVIGCTFADISGSGIQVGDFNDAEPSYVGADNREINSGNTLQDNYIHAIGQEYHGAVGIFLGYTRNSLVTHNQVNDVPYSGITIGGEGAGDASTIPNVAQDNKITNNLIFNDLEVLADGGSIYTNGLQAPDMADGLLIDGNVAHDQQHNYNTLYTDDGSRYITLTHNVLYNNQNNNDWGGCDPVGNMDFEYNYYQKTLGSWCTAPSNITVANNTQLSNLAACQSDSTCNGILSNAGIEAAYQDILSGGATVTTVDDSVQGSGTNQFNYIGSGWGHCLGVSNCGDPTGFLYNDSNSWDNVSNEYVTITFTGTQIAFYSVLDPSGGIGAISIDGGSETNVDTYNATRQGDVLVWTSTTLAAGSHTLKWRVTGNHNNNSSDYYVPVDRVVITS